MGISEDGFPGGLCGSLSRGGAAVLFCIFCPLLADALPAPWSSPFLSSSAPWKLSAVRGPWLAPPRSYCLLCPSSPHTLFTQPVSVSRYHWRCLSTRHLPTRQPYESLEWVGMSWPWQRRRGSSRTWGGSWHWGRTEHREGRVGRAKQWVWPSAQSELGPSSHEQGKAGSLGSRGHGRSASWEGKTSHSQPRKSLNDCHDDLGKLRKLMKISSCLMALINC